MGYLEIGAAPLTNFKKAIISIPFRAPSLVLSAVQALPDSEDLISDGFSNVYPALHKIIPLMTLGSIESTFGGIGALTPTSPSFIGVDCVSPFFAPTLAVNLQMPNKTTYSAALHPEDQWRNDVFYMRGRGDFGDPGTQALVVTPDVWHHALVSFDLTDSCSCYYSTTVEFGAGAPSLQITPGPTFSWAFDDVGKVGLSMAKSGGALWNLTPNMAAIPENSIIPSGLISGAAGDLGSTATWSSSAIASSGKPIGIPTSSQFITNAFNIEYSTIQVFTDISADVTDEAIRRLFLAADGTLVNPSVAAAALGVAPKICLFGSKNFKIGKNTGTIGNFTKSGTINNYSPGFDLTP